MRLLFASLLLRLRKCAELHLRSPITRKPGGAVDAPVATIGARLGATPEQVLLAWAKAKGTLVVTYVVSRHTYSLLMLTEYADRAQRNRGWKAI